MAINPKLKSQFETMTMDEAYRAKLIETLDAAPADVQNLWMAQSDYTSKINDYKSKMDEFYAKSNTSIEQWKGEVQKATDAVAQANARIAELEGSVNNGMPKVPGQDDAVFKEITGLKTLITDLTTKSVTPQQLDEAYNRAVGFIGEQILELTEIGARHQERFGKRFDKNAQAELVTYANTKATELKRSVSLEEAYNMKNGDELKKIERAQIEKEVEERLRTAHNIPGAHEGPAGGAPVERGPAQIRMEQEQNRRAGITDASKIGFGSWQEAAAAAANELVSEGKL